MRTVFITLVALLTMSALGCSSSPTYECQLINKTRSQLSVGMVHRSEPGIMPQPDWAGPEHIAMVPNNVMQKHWGALAEPGNLLILGPKVGPPGGTAVLRIYRSNGTVQQLTGYTRDDPGRSDTPIYPGKNSFIVTEVSGRLVTEPTEWHNVPPPPSAPK